MSNSEQSSKPEVYKPMVSERVPPNMKLKLTKEPVTSVACATAAPEPLGSLTWCWASEHPSFGGKK